MPFGASRFGFTLTSAGLPYEGTDTSADLLWHLKKIPTSASSGTATSVTTGNGYESNGINVNGTTFAAKFTEYDGNTTFGSGSIAIDSGSLGLFRVNGNMTVSSGFTLATSDNSRGMYGFVDGDITIEGTVAGYSSGIDAGSSQSAFRINSSTNSVAGSSTVEITGSAAAHTNGSSTAATLTTGGGGQGGQGSYGHGSGATGHTFGGGSGGGGGGGIAYYQHYQGGGNQGSTADTYGGAGGAGGSSGYTHWGYWTSDAGGTGGTGSTGGAAGANNSRNASSSRVGDAGYSDGIASNVVLYATGDITVASGGTISSLGRVGKSGDGTAQLDSGGGGGTGGGVIVAICAGTFTNNGTVSAAGGACGAGRGSAGSAGGNGGVLTGGSYG
jgi:hypothetical protein